MSATRRAEHKRVTSTDIDEDLAEGERPAAPHHAVREFALAPPARPDLDEMRQRAPTQVARLEEKLGAWTERIFGSGADGSALESELRWEDIGHAFDSLLSGDALWEDVGAVFGQDLEPKRERHEIPAGSDASLVRAQFTSEADIAAELASHGQLVLPPPTAPIPGLRPGATDIPVTAFEAVVAAGAAGQPFYTSARGATDSWGGMAALAKRLEGVLRQASAHNGGPGVDHAARLFQQLTETSLAQGRSSQDAADLVVDQLQNTSQAVFPACSNHHAMYAIAKLDPATNTVALTLYNSGDGLSKYHAAQPGAPGKYATAYQVEGIPLDRFNASLKGMFDLRATPGATVDQVYAWANGLGTHVPTNPSDPNVVWQAEQKGSDCTLEGMFALLRNNLDVGAYKAVKAGYLSEVSALVGGSRDADGSLTFSNASGTTSRFAPLEAQALINRYNERAANAIEEVRDGAPSSLVESIAETLQAAQASVLPPGTDRAHGIPSTRLSSVPDEFRETLTAMQKTGAEILAQTEESEGGKLVVYIADGPNAAEAKRVADGSEQIASATVVPDGTFDTFLRFLRPDGYYLNFYSDGLHGIGPGVRPAAPAPGGTPGLGSINTDLMAAGPRSGTAVDVATDLSAAAYETDPAKVEAAVRAAGYEGYIPVDVGPNRAIVAYGHGKPVAVAFRGSDNLANWGQNLAFSQHNIGASGIHDGFELAVLEMSGRGLEAAIRDAKAASGASSVLFTGHSLGGAMATIAAYHHATSGEDDVWGVIPVASPRVGNRAFVKSYDELLSGRTTPVVHEGDEIPHLPWSTGFGALLNLAVGGPIDWAHVAAGNRVTLADDGTVSVGQDLTSAALFDLRNAHDPRTYQRLTDGALASGALSAALSGPPPGDNPSEAEGLIEELAQHIPAGQLDPSVKLALENELKANFMLQDLVREFGNEYPGWTITTDPGLSLPVTFDTATGNIVLRGDESPGAQVSHLIEAFAAGTAKHRLPDATDDPHQRELLAVLRHHEVLSSSSALSAYDWYAEPLAQSWTDLAAYKSWLAAHPDETPLAGLLTWGLAALPG